VFLAPKSILTAIPLQTNGDPVWKDRVEKLANQTLGTFFPKNVAFEIPCEGQKGACTADMLSFKGYVHRWLSVVTQVAPFTRQQILPVLRESAAAAVRQCTGGESGRRCGFYWSEGVYVDPAVDQTTGAGEAMNVLAAVSSLLIEEAPGPVTAANGGISEGNPNAGGRGDIDDYLRPITTGDRVGAGILTVLMLGVSISTFGWMLM
jgi:mannan endo-1,6-alpha-mannosidase